MTGSPSTTANGISPCAGAPAPSAVTGGGACGTSRRFGLEALAGCSSNYASPATDEVEREKKVSKGRSMIAQSTPLTTKSMTMIRPNGSTRSSASETFAVISRRALGHHQVVGSEAD